MDLKKKNIFFPTTMGVLMCNSSSLCLNAGLCHCLETFTLCSTESNCFFFILNVWKTLSSLQQLIIMSAALHVGFMTRHSFQFPWMCVSWDEVWLMSDLSWAPSYDFFWHLQSDGYKKGNNVPFNVTRHQSGTSVPQSGHVHVWVCCCSLALREFLSWSNGSRMPPQALTSQLGRGGQASSQIQQTQPGCRCMIPPESLFTDTLTYNCHQKSRRQ